MEREATILAHLPLVHAAVRRLRVPAAAPFSHEDALSCGTLGLIEAVDRFDPAGGAQLSTYAAQRIHGAIVDGLRAACFGPRRTGGTCTEREDVAEPWQLVSLERPRGERDDGTAVATLAEALPDHATPPPEELVLERALAADIRVAYGTLHARAREVLALFYGRGLLLREIGALCGISESAACLRLRTAERLLRGALGLPEPPQGQSNRTRSPRARAGAAAASKARERARSPVTAADVARIRALRASGLTCVSIAQGYPVCANTISRICRGQVWSDDVAETA